MQDRDTIIRFASNCLASGCSPERVLNVVFDSGKYQGMQEALTALDGVVRRHEVEQVTADPAGTGAA